MQLWLPLGPSPSGKECEQILSPETCPLCVLVSSGPGAFKSTDPAMGVIITPFLHMRKKRFREVK